MRKNVLLTLKKSNLREKDLTQTENAILPLISSEHVEGGGRKGHDDRYRGGGGSSEKYIVI